jgi:endonuclease YncB( thermonuclease family)
MRRVGLVALVLLLSFATPALAQTSQNATVERVVDGDTIEVRPAVPGTESVRLIGVDTPETVDPGEPVQPYGPQASAFTKRQLEGKRVTLIFDQEKTDQYDRALAYVRVGGQASTFNETLLRQGYGQLLIISPNDRYEDRFRQAQEEAKRAQRGIWGLPINQQCELANRGNGIGEGSPGCSGGNPRPAPPGPTPPADKNCSDYPSQAAAQAELRRDPNDPYGLDGPVGRASTGIPGVACEGNPPPEDLTPVPGYGGSTPPQDPQPPGELPRTGGASPPVGAVLVLGVALVATRGILRR